MLIALVVVTNRGASLLHWKRNASRSRSRWSQLALIVTFLFVLEWNCPSAGPILTPGLTLC